MFAQVGPSLPNNSWVAMGAGRTGYLASREAKKKKKAKQGKWLPVEIRDSWVFCLHEAFEELFLCCWLGVWFGFLWKLPWEMRWLLEKIAFLGDSHLSLGNPRRLR